MAHAKNMHRYVHTWSYVFEVLKTTWHTWKILITMCSHTHEHSHYTVLHCIYICNFFKYPSCLSCVCMLYTIFELMDKKWTRYYYSIKQNNRSNGWSTTSNTLKHNETIDWIHDVQIRMHFSTVYHASSTVSIILLKEYHSIALWEKNSQCHWNHKQWKSLIG